MGLKGIVVMPAYNEEDSIGQVLAILIKVTDHLDKHLDLILDVLVVDDGSTDGTSEVARTYGARVIRHTRNMGPGAAVRTGFIYAVENGYDLVVQMDADGQHLPEEVPKLILPIIEDEADIVIGSRFLASASYYKMPYMKLAGIKFYSVLVSFLANRLIMDVTSGFRAFNIEAVEAIAPIYPSDFPALKSTLMLAKRGFRIIEVPVKMRPRVSGRSYISGLNLMKYHVRALKSIAETVFK